MFGLLNDAGLRIRARRQVKCSARKAIYRRGDVNVNEGHGDILFAVYISKRNLRNGKIGGLRRDPLQTDWMQIFGMKASYSAYLRIGTLRRVSKFPIRRWNQRIYPETSYGDIRSTRGSRASSPLNSALLEQLLPSYPCGHASRGFSMYSASNSLVYGAEKRLDKIKTPGNS